MKREELPTEDRPMATQDDVRSEATDVEQRGFDHTLFKPRDYEGKPRNLSKPHRRTLGQFIEYIDQRIDEMSPVERRELLDACLSVSPINCGWDIYKIAEIAVWHLHECESARAHLPTTEDDNG